MTLEQAGTVGCPDCGREQEIQIWRSINVSARPELKTMLFEGKINIFECPSCGSKARIAVPLMYHDMDRQYCVHYVPPEDLDDTTLGMFEKDGTLRADLPEYMRAQHIVFEMSEMIRYVLFRDRLSDYHEREARGEVDLDEFEEPTDEQLLAEERAEESEEEPGG